MEQERARQRPAEWITAQEFADELKVPLETVYTWNSNGTAPRRARFGKHVRYNRRDIDAWVAERYGSDEDSARNGRS